MKKYLQTLKQCLWVAIFLPIIIYTCSAVPWLNILSAQWIYLFAYIVLFMWAGTKPWKSGYSILQSAFAGPVLLLISELVSWPLQFITYQTVLADTPLWVIAIRTTLQSTVSLFFCFPIALGFSALGAYLKKKDDKAFNQRLDPIVKTPVDEV